MQHIQAPEQAERLIERCREIFDSEPVFTSEVGPVIGTYTGPGLIGVGAIRARCSAEAGVAARERAIASSRPPRRRHQARWAAQRGPSAGGGAADATTPTTAARR